MEATNCLAKRLHLKQKYWIYQIIYHIRDSNSNRIISMFLVATDGVRLKPMFGYVYSIAYPNIIKVINII